MFGQLTTGLEAAWSKLKGQGNSMLSSMFLLLCILLLLLGDVMFATNYMLAMSQNLFKLLGEYDLFCYLYLFYTKRVDNFFETSQEEYEFDQFDGTKGALVVLWPVWISMI